MDFPIRPISRWYQRRVVSCQYEYVGAVVFVIYVVVFLRRNLRAVVGVYFKFQVDKVAPPPYYQMYMQYAKYFNVAEQSAPVKASIACLSPFLLLMGI
jgi:hypothetical protein